MISLKLEVETKIVTLYVCTCVHIHTTYIHVVHVHTCTYVHVHVHVCVHMYVHVHYVPLKTLTTDFLLMRSL